MADTYRQMFPNDINYLGALTGKTVVHGGVRGRNEATGRGVQYALRELFRHPGELERCGLSAGLAGKQVIVQGLGNVGYHAAHFLEAEDDCLITAIMCALAAWNAASTRPEASRSSPPLSRPLASRSPRI